VLYPNEHLKDVDETRAQIDIEECSHEAESYVRSNPGAKVVGGTIVAGAATGLVRGIYNSFQPSTVYKAFVKRCLRDKGYDPIGWE
jgi:predicted house-cleaning NTP pyrophosphatase (Maf/HAM1 superfamily)